MKESFLRSRVKESQFAPIRLIRHGNDNLAEIIVKIHNIVIESWGKHI